MSGICGIIRLDGDPVDGGDVESMVMAAAYRAPDGVQLRSGPGWCGARLARFVTPEDPLDPQPAQSGASWLVADARIDNLAELSALLTGELAGRPLTTSAVLHAAFRRWGSSCPERLVGDYAFVLWDEVRCEVFAARDPSGVRSLHYRVDGNRFWFATEVKQILAAPGTPIRLFEPAVAGHLAGGYERPEWTFYEGIRRLPPGHSLEVSTGREKVREFWDPMPARSIRYARESTYAEHFRELLDEAVRCRVRGPHTAGVLLSGGVDSGTVTSVAAKLCRTESDLAPDLRTYSFAFAELPDSDERAVSDTIVHAHGLSAVSVPGDDAWPLSDFPNHGPERDSPFAWVYQRLIGRCATRAASDGVRVLLTGEGGDELVGDEIFDLPGILRAGRLPRLHREVGALAARRAVEPADIYRTELLRPLRRAVARFPGMEALGPRAHRGTLPRRHPIVDGALAKRTDVDQLVLASPKHSWQRMSPLERRQLRLSSPHLPRLLAWQENLHARCGVGAAMPLADQRLVRFVLAVPPWVVNAPSEPKRLARLAVRGTMPEAARRGAKKVEPLGLYQRGMLERGVEVVRDLGSGREMVRRGFVNPSALADAVETHVSGRTPSYDLWWALTMEWWLRTHWPDQ